MARCCIFRNSLKLYLILTTATLFVLLLLYFRHLVLGTFDNTQPTNSSETGFFTHGEFSNDVINCDRLVTDEVYLNLVSNQQKISQIHKNAALSEKNLFEAGKHCPEFVQTRGYITEPRTDEEKNFPIAFSLIVFRDPDRVERLLRSIYQPQNVYCIHVDNASSETLFSALESLEKCLPGVFMASRRVNVIWGHYSVLEAELVCMEDLLKRSRKWKYFINLTGQEFPLKTNYELVKILKTYGGANDIAGYSPQASRQFLHRIHYVWRLSQHDHHRIQTKFRKDALPYNASFIKGRVHITATREFVEFAVRDEKARVLATWLRDTGIPDETFFSVLQYNHHMGAPGSQMKPEYKPNESVNRYKIFGPSQYCHGKFSHSICIFGLRDLPNLYHAATDGLYLFANKFHADYDPLAYDCLEKLIRQRTIQNSTTFDVRRYEKLFFVKNYRYEKNKRS